MPTPSHVIGRNVRRFREKAGMSQAKLAKAIGVAQNTIAAIELGKTRKSKYLPDIASVLKVTIRDLDPGTKSDETTIVPSYALIGENDLPLHSSVEAGEGMIVVSGDAIDAIRRPASLAKVREAYGVIVKGDSMVPVVRPGAIVLVNPHLAPQREDLCLFISDIDGVFRATLKEYCGQTAGTWQVKRYQPRERKFALAKKEWPRCDVVVGCYFRR